MPRMVIAGRSHPPPQVATPPRTEWPLTGIVGIPPHTLIPMELLKPLALIPKVTISPNTATVEGIVTNSDG